jgi:hypothetical protein
MYSPTKEVICYSTYSTLQSTHAVRNGVLRKQSEGHFIICFFVAKRSFHFQVEKFHFFLIILIYVCAFANKKLFLNNDQHRQCTVIIKIIDTL